MLNKSLFYVKEIKCSSCISKTCYGLFHCSLFSFFCPTYILFGQGLQPNTGIVLLKKLILPAAT
jgi:hypothetical protein